MNKAFDKKDTNLAWLYRQIYALSAVSHSLKKKQGGQPLAARDLAITRLKLSYAYAALEMYKKGINTYHLGRLGSSMWFYHNDGINYAASMLIEECSNKQVKSFCNRVATRMFDPDQHLKFKSSSVRRNVI